MNGSRIGHGNGGSVVSGYTRRHQRPSSLRDEQLSGQTVTRAAAPIPVMAWILWSDGTSEEIAGTAQEWTARAVHVTWRAGHRLGYEAWVWAGAVRRR